MIQIAYKMKMYREILDNILKYKILSIYYYMCAFIVFGILYTILPIIITTLSILYLYL